MIKWKKILYGICGIGNWHTFRQFPILEALSTSNKIVLFVYDSSYEFYSNYFSDNKNIVVHQVKVPFYDWTSKWLDFESMLLNPLNQNSNYFEENCKAFALADKTIWRPDFVISDYEPVSAQYAYAYNSPLITIDQQSKYLYESNFQDINNLSIKDEVMRLRMFFPKAYKRIACSFFNVEKTDESDVDIFSPILREKVVNLKRNPDNKTILVYISSNKQFWQSVDQIADILITRTDYDFYVFLPKNISLPEWTFTNIKFFKFWDKCFDEILWKCVWIISTSWHNLLSEAMYLGVPVYALPLEIYEQQMNAEIIYKHWFWLKSNLLDEVVLDRFLNNLDTFKKNIKNDSKVLLRSDGQSEILELLQNLFW